MGKRITLVKGSHIMIIICSIIIFFTSYFCTTLCYNNYCDNHNYPVQIITKDYKDRYYIQEIVNENENIIEIIDIYNNHYIFNKNKCIIKYKYNIE